MKIRLQTGITIFLFILFLVSAPFVILYTAGYRLNLRTQRIERTGILIVRTLPEDAQILLDDIVQQKETPARFPRLLPREYHISIKKSGYHVWEKTLAVESNRTTFVQDLILFPDRLPERQISVDVTAIAVAENGNLAYDATSAGVSEIWIRPANQDARLVTRFPRTGDTQLDFEWNEAGTQLLVTTTDLSQTLIVDAQTFSVTNGLDLSDSPISSPSWIPGAQDALFFVSENRAFTVTPPNDPVPFGIHPAEAAWYQNGTYYLAQKATSTMDISSFRDDAIVENEATIELPRGEVSFLPSPSGFLTIRSHNTIRVFDTSQGGKIFEGEVRGATWNTGATTELLVWTDFEISIFKPADGSTTLLTRLSTPIAEAAWYPGGTHILYVAEDALRAIGRDERGGFFTTTLFHLPGFSSFAVDRASEYILGIAEPNDRLGIYQYMIEVP